MGTTLKPDLSLDEHAAKGAAEKRTRLCGLLAGIQGEVTSFLDESRQRGELQIPGVDSDNLRAATSYLIALGLQADAIALHHKIKALDDRFDDYIVHRFFDDPDLCKWFRRTGVAVPTSADPPDIARDRALLVKGAARDLVDFIERLQADLGTAPTAPAQANDHEGMSREEVGKRLERLRDQGDRYTSQDQLAKQIGCSPSTVNAAINESPPLKGWMTRAKEGKSPRATRFTEVAADNIAQTGESAPADVLPGDDVDAVMARLIEQAQPAERARLNSMSPEDRRSLVRTYQQQQHVFEPSSVEDDPPGSKPRRVKQPPRP